jgi:uncharacterized damage-inducible protein DinB
MSIAQRMLPELDDEMARTRVVLNAVPNELLNWSPVGLRTIGWNANHLAEIIGWTAGILEQSEFDIAPVDGPKYETPSLSDAKQIVASFDDNLQSARSTLALATDNDLAQEWAMKMGGQTIFQMTKGDCIRKWVFNHTIHHRAILATYLRMNGVELTPVYDN